MLHSTRILTYWITKQLRFQSTLSIFLFRDQIFGYVLSRLPIFWKKNHSRTKIEHYELEYGAFCPVKHPGPHLSPSRTKGTIGWYETTRSWILNFYSPSTAQRSWKNSKTSSHRVLVLWALPCSHPVLKRSKKWKVNK